MLNYDSIVVFYWVRSKSMEEKVGIPHNTIYEYSLEKQREISELALEKGYHVMLRPGMKNTLLIAIDDRRFTQR